MTYPLAANSPKKAPARAFGRELVRALEHRGIPRSELWRATGIGRTALDNYRTGSSLPRIEAAAAIAAVLDWPKLLEIVRHARTRSCEQCGRPFTNDGGNQGAKRFCSTACRDIAAQERLASTRIRKAGQTDDARQTRAAIQRLRSGIRIAEERGTELAAAIDAMCLDCEPLGVCRTADCPLRAFSPLPFRAHATGATRSIDEIRRGSWDAPGRRKRQSETSKRRWDRPGERERQAQHTRSYFAGLSEAEKLEHGRRVSVARRAS